MLFNSIEFMLFLPVVFILYWFVCGRSLRLQNVLVVVASYVFYGWWDWRFLILIAFTSLCSWLSGVLIQRYRCDSRQGNCGFVQGDNFQYVVGGGESSASAADAVSGRRSKLVLWLNIGLNLAILGFFKYFNFFVESFVDAFALCGETLHPATLKIILPVGISFYTFQALSYSIDVYNGKIEATKDIVAFFAYVSFFPQLVAGPIERATNLLPQFERSRKFDCDVAFDGVRQIIWGLFKKMVVADNCAVYVDKVFSTYTTQSGSTLLLAAILFAFQIYGDFSGYSDVAIGTSKLFGIRLMRNFNVPYFSRDIAEFWRRWHISLTTWFRDYIYIPLGGSRTTKAKVVRNTFIIFLVSGLWHGANWTFVAWGAYHAVLFLPLILMGRNRRYRDVVAASRLLPSLSDICRMALTFLLVVMGWILFRSDSVGEAWSYVSHIADISLFSVPFIYVGTKKAVFFTLIMLCVEWLARNREHGMDFMASIPQWVRISSCFAVTFVILEYAAHSQSFIYFQF